MSEIFLRGGTVKIWRLVLVTFAVGVVIGTGLFSRTLSIKPEDTATGATYVRFCMHGNYAYCPGHRHGIDILDMSTPTSPKRVGNYDTPGAAYDMKIRGSYAYVADSREGLQVLDISNPVAPKRVGNYKLPAISYPTTSIMHFHLEGDYIYLAYGYDGLVVLDISSPTQPLLVSQTKLDGAVSLVSGAGNLVYTVEMFWNFREHGRAKERGISSTTDLNSYGKLKVIDMTNPFSPVVLGSYTCNNYISDLIVHDNRAYLGCNYQTIPSPVVDVSNPRNPVYEGDLIGPNTIHGLSFRDGYIYASAYENGFYIIDVSSPGGGRVTGHLDAKCTRVQAAGKYCYILGHERGMGMVDVSNPSAPVLAGTFRRPGSIMAGRAVYEGNHAYVLDKTSPDGYFQVYDISTPGKPEKKGEYKMSKNFDDVFVSGGYAYVVESKTKLTVMDVSSPSSPVPAASLSCCEDLRRVVVNGDYAFLADGKAGLKIVDVSDPSAPVLKKELDLGKTVTEIDIFNNTAYIGTESHGLLVYDVSAPLSPVEIGTNIFFDEIKHIQVSGNLALVATRSFLYWVALYGTGSSVIMGGDFVPDGDLYYNGDLVFYAGTRELLAFDISQPYEMELVGKYLYDGYGSAGLIVRGDYIYVACGPLMTFSFSETTQRPVIQLDKTRLDFVSIYNNITGPSQPVSISNGGGGNLNCQLTLSADWFTVSPESGSGDREFYVSVNPKHYDLAPGQYTGEITVTDPLATNSPQTVTVNLEVKADASGSPPFGSFDLPLDGSTVSGSIPVTGWALDNMGVKKVSIYYEINGKPVYLDDAVMVEGARPDVEQAFPGYPGNRRAGWGYMLLTNYLASGNGSFVLHAVATDIEGNETTLGTKQILIDNANAVKPFGAIDTPKQGGVASGSEYVNFGWALTPMPKTIPFDGSTIRVWIDGVPVGNPVYNQYRKDVASLFPGYNNSDGAVGYFYMDTTGYADGVHTIQWTATDDAGKTDGIGSRFFSIWNGNSRETGTAHARLKQKTVAAGGHIELRTGFDVNGAYRAVDLDDDGTCRVKINGMGRLEMVFPIKGSAKNLQGYQQVGAKTYGLPPGSVLDRESGKFYWQPGPGFGGGFELVFVWGEEGGVKERVRVFVDLELP